MDIAVLLSHTYMTVMPQSNVQKKTFISCLTAKSWSRSVLNDNVVFCSDYYSILI